MPLRNRGQSVPASTDVNRNTQDISLIPATASDRAVRFLRAMIFSGELGPGDKLPPERDLGAHLGISRMTLRLALKALESTGYIVTTRGSRGGSRVADAESLLDCWNQWMRHHAGELDDIFEFRMTVETRLAALAAARRTQEDLDNMENVLANAMHRKEWADAFRADIDIHRSIARAARSPRLEQAMLDTRGSLFVPIDLRSLEDRDGQVEITHFAIFEAIRARDAEAAAAHMRRHIETIRSLTDKALTAAGIVSPAR